MKAKIGMQLKCPKTLIYSAIYPLFLGCQTTGGIPDDEGHLSVSVEQKVVQLVSDSAASIESHMRSLRQMDFARDPVVPRVTQVPLWGRIAEKVDLRWTGPAQASCFTTVVCTVFGIRSAGNIFTDMSMKSLSA